MGALTGRTLPSWRSRPAGLAGHCQPNKGVGGFRAWLLLARPRRVSRWALALHEPAILAQQDQGEPRARRPEAAGATRAWIQGVYCVGVRPKTQQKAQRTHPEGSKIRRRN